MKKLQNTLAQLNENNFDILNNNGMNMLKGGTYGCNTGCNSGSKSKKSKKAKKIKSVKSVKSNSGGYNSCGW